MYAIRSYYEIELTADRSNISADGQDLSFITVRALDKNGIPCPLADNKITFEVSGNGTIAGVGNGNQASLESLQGDNIKLFSGMALFRITSYNVCYTKLLRC